MLNLSQRPASTDAADISALAAMNADLLREEGSPVPEEEILRHRLIGWITGEGYDKHAVHLIYLDDHLAGFFSSRLWPGEGLVLLRQLFVVPNLRRRGIATWAIQRIKDSHPEALQILAVVTKSNAPSQALFTHVGGIAYAEVFALGVS